MCTLPSYTPFVAVTSERSGRGEHRLTVELELRFMASRVKHLVADTHGSTVGT